MQIEIAGGGNHCLRILLLTGPAAGVMATICSSPFSVGALYYWPPVEFEVAVGFANARDAAMEALKSTEDAAIKSEHSVCLGYLDRARTSIHCVGNACFVSVRALQELEGAAYVAWRGSLFFSHNTRCLWVFFSPGPEHRQGQCRKMALHTPSCNQSRRYCSCTPPFKQSIHACMHAMHAMHALYRK